MQKGVLIKDNGTLISKEVYAGRVDNLSDVLTARYTGQENITFEIYDDTDSEFVNA